MTFTTLLLIPTAIILGPLISALLVWLVSSIVPRIQRSRFQAGLHIKPSFRWLWGYLPIMLLSSLSGIAIAYPSFRVAEFGDGGWEWLIGIIGLQIVQWILVVPAAWLVRALNPNKDISSFEGFAIPLMFNVLGASFIYVLLLRLFLQEVIRVFSQ